jgi:hypothetical protein
VPLVTYDLDDDTCPERLDITDPVTLSALRLHAQTDPVTFCVGTAVGPAIRLTVTGSPGDPSAATPEIWIDRDSTLAFVYCEYVAPVTSPCDSGDVRVI